jgi:hypothetical protein
MKTNDPKTNMPAEDSEDILEEVIDQVIQLELDLVGPWHPDDLHYMSEDDRKIIEVSEHILDAIRRYRGDVAGTGKDVIRSSFTRYIEEMQKVFQGMMEDGRVEFSGMHSEFSYLRLELQKLVSTPNYQTIPKSGGGL